MRHQPRPARIGWLVGVVVALAVVAGVGRLLAASSGPAPADAPVVEGVAAVGRPAPRVELPGLRGGRVRLADLRGHPVVVNFWASRCPPCVAEMPDFQRVHRRLGDRVAFLGINQRDHRQAAEELAPGHRRHLPAGRRPGRPGL